MRSNESNNNYNNKSGSEMLSEIGRLLWQLFLKCIARLLKLIQKGFLLCFALLKLLLQACIDFWNDNSTQEMLHIIKAWCIKAIKKLGSLCIAGCIALWKGILWTIRATIRGIIHLKPTLIYLGNLCKKAGKAIWRGTVICGKSIRLYFLKRQHAFRRFRRNKGFKGLLIDIKEYLQSMLNNYMEEDNDTTSSDAISYEEYVNGNKTNGKKSFSSKLYQEMNKLIDN
jgi:hypothetical protein